MALGEYRPKQWQKQKKGNLYKNKWCLVVRDPRYPEFERVYAVIELNEFLELLKKIKNQ